MALEASVVSIADYSQSKKASRISKFYAESIASGLITAQDCAEPLLARIVIENQSNGVSRRETRLRIP